MRASLRTLAAVGAVLVLGAGCSGPSYEALLEASRASVAKKDHKTALVELKSALQKRPESPEARFLLGKTLYESGDAGAAIVELDKAAQLTYDANQVAPLAARALLVLGRNKLVTDRYPSVELKDPRAAADLKTSVAKAFQRQNMTEQADTMLAEALAADPGYGPARLIQAMNLALKEDVPGALALVDEVLQKDPAFGDAWMVKGRLLIAAGRPHEEARVAFKKTVEFNPTEVLAHSALFDLALMARDPAAMEEVAAGMRKALPTHPELALYEAQLSIVRDDLKLARERLQRLLKTSPQNVRVLYLSGLVAQAGGSYIEAEGHLGKAVALAPEKTPSRHLLARVYMQMGQPEKSLQTLKPLISGRMVEIESLALAAESNLMLGDSATAYRLFQRAAQADPKNPRLRTALAVARFRRGEAEAALAELQGVAASDPGTFADMALISLRLSRKEYDAALKAIDGLRRKQPDKPFPLVVQGRAHLARNDLAAARTSFTRAAEVDPAYFPAVQALAGIDLNEKKSDAARQRLEAFLRAQGNHPRAQMALADVVQRSGGTLDEARVLLERATAASPGDAAPRLALVRVLMRSGDTQRALAEAHAATSVAPGSVEVLEVLASVQVATGDFQQAAANYRKIADSMQGGLAVQLRLADMLHALDDATGAEQSYRRVVAAKADHLPAQRRLIELMLRGRRHDEAMRIVKRVQDQRPKEAVGWLLEAEVEAHRARWEPALAALATAAKVGGDTSVVAARTHATLVASGDEARAEQFARQWLGRNPRNDNFVVYLGVHRLGRGEYAQAEADFLKADQIKPNDPVTLNNIAYAMMKQGKKGAAEVAAKADRMKPNTPAFLDTLALALVSEGRADEALPIQERAVTMMPSDLNLKLTLARIHAARGDKLKARKELERLLGSGRSFAGAADAKSLLASI